MGVDRRWGATLKWAEWQAEHLAAPPGKKTIKTQDKSVYERVKDRVYGHVICRVNGHFIKLVDGGGGTGGGMGHCISVIAECRKNLRGKSTWSKNKSAMSILEGLNQAKPPLKLFC